jgi:flagellar assembly factor FliW
VFNANSSSISAISYIIASAPVNMKDYASDVPTQHTMTITLKPASKKIVKASIQLTLSCVFLREGKAT